MRRNPQFDKHHVHPRSRGGPNGWNTVSVRFNLHHGFNKIFNVHPTVYEAITIIKHCWTDENGKFKYWLFSKKQLEEWLKLFRTLDTSRAIEILKSELAHKPEDREKYERWLRDRKEKFRESALKLERKYRKGGDQ